MPPIETTLKSKVVKEAGERLVRSAYDLYHTLDHHLEVLKGCREIAEHDLIQINWDILEIACYWHDVFKGMENEELQLRETLLSLDLERDIVEQIIQIIAEHSFGKTQTSNESRLLYDADKIELVSIERWKRVFDAYKRGEIDVNARDKYIREWNRRMPLLENHLHFPFANQIFSSKLRSFREWLKSIDRLDANEEFISQISYA